MNRRCRETRDQDTSSFQPGETVSRLYPEVHAGGYTRYDGLVEFYTRVNALLDEESRVLDFGAGRGQWAVEPMPRISRQLRAFRDRVGRVVGVDVDDVVLENKSLDEALVVGPGERLPFEDGAFDLVVADYVFEHVDEAHAPQVASELLRVLRPGGWVAARTPNKWGVIGLGARAIPNRRHAAVLSRLQPDRKVEDIFPTRYAMNTRKHLRRLFPEPGAHLYVYGHTTEPLYVGSSPTAWRAASFVDRLTPPRMAPTLMVFVQKAEEKRPVSVPAQRGPAAS